MDRTENAGLGLCRSRSESRGSRGSKPVELAPQGPPGIDERFSKNSDAGSVGDPGGGPCGATRDRGMTAGRPRRRRRDPREAIPALSSADLVEFLETLQEPK